MASDCIYLDNHSTTRVDPRVLEAMLPYFCERYGNAASVQHELGAAAADAVERARAQIAALVNCTSRELIFTSGATESNNIALFGVLRAAGPGSHLVTAAAEHRSILDPARRLKRQGFEVTFIGVDDRGRVDPEQVAQALRPNTALVSVMLANNEVGTINDVARIAALCRSRDVLVHTDAAQAAGRIPVDLAELPVDLLSISAHKIYGPKGVGGLFVRRGDRRIVIEPLVEGGGHERRLRSGTLPVPLIVGMGKAAEIARQSLAEESVRLVALRDRLWHALRNRIEGILLNGPELEPSPGDLNRLPGNLNVSFERVDGEALLAGLQGIAVSSGSACSAADPEPSHVLRAMGRSDALTRASLRFGIGRFNTPEEIDRGAEIVAATVDRLRQGSPRSA